MSSITGNRDKANSVDGGIGGDRMQVHRRTSLAA
jgi:hypothetical protein